MLRHLRFPVVLTLLAAVLAFAPSGWLHAADPAPALESAGGITLKGLTTPGNFGGLRIVAENDVGFSDQFYTNGVRLEYLSRESYALNPARWLAYLAAGLTGLEAYGDEPAAHYSSVFVAADSFTPRYITKADISFGDRPYASWTYLGSVFHMNDGREFLTAEIQAGGMGPGTGSRVAQTAVHRNSRLSRSPNGWDHQMPSTAGVNLVTTYERRVFAADIAYDAAGDTRMLETLLYIRPRVGNIYTDLQAGFQLNIGKPGPGDHQKIWRGDEHDGDSGYAYFYIRPGVRAVGYNATLEGPWRPAGSRAVHIYREDHDAKYLAYHSLTKDKTGLSDAERLSSFQDLVRYRNTIDYRRNFLTFNRTFYGEDFGNVGERMLIYETLFGETLRYERDDQSRFEVEALIIHSLQQSNVPVTGENLYFWHNTLFRSDEVPLSPVTRWIAFRKLNEGRGHSSAEQAYQYVMLFNGGRIDNQKVGVPPRRTVGEIDLGISMGTGPLRANLGWTAHSGDFERQLDIPAWHGYWHVELVYLF